MQIYLMFPRMFCLLPSKYAPMYIYLLERIITRIQETVGVTRPNLAWRHISMDFENGMIAALHHVVPHINFPDPIQEGVPVSYNVELLGCHFHFCQACYKHLSPTNHLTTQYHNADYSSSICDCS
mmetsp:Transcript_101745/g.199592  ORF Transcript_101745/g.199592 Transcript_101745/m.199592 type:complete len:125 (+) Transcript_101745:122-496(+)